MKIHIYANVDKQKQKWMFISSTNEWPFGNDNNNNNDGSGDDDGDDNNNNRHTNRTQTYARRREKIE